MKKYYKIFLLTLVFVIIMIVVFSKLNLTVLSAEYHKNYESVYPSNCFVKFENKKYLIKSIYKYKFKIFREYWQVGTAGFAIRKSLGDDDLILKFRKSGSKIIYNSNEYEISEIRKDTYISKISNDEIMLFVD